MATARYSLNSTDRRELLALRWRTIAGALIALGVVLRVWEFAARRSLWNDEATIAINIAWRSFAGLLEPLDLGQAAPPLFLLVTKAAVAAFGVNEWALRLPSLVSGVALLPLFAGVARQLLPARAALFALALVVVAPALVYFANEVKPYGLDAFVTVLLLWVWLRARSPGAALAASGLAAAAGAIGVWASYPAIFVLAALGLTAVAADLKDGNRPRLRRTLAIGIVWLVSFVIAYVAFYHDVTRDPYMLRFWGASFLTTSPDPLGRLAEVVGGPMSGTFFDRDLFELLPSGLQAVVVAAALALCLIGTRYLRQHAGAPALGFVAGPVVLVGMAYLVGRYPVALRLVLFTAPLVALLLAAGFHRMLGARSQALYATAAFGLLVPAGYHAVLQLRDPWRRLEQPRPVIEALLDRLNQSGEPLWVAPGAATHWVFYTTDWSAPDSAQVEHLLRHAAPPHGLAFPNHAPRSAPADPTEARGLIYRGETRDEYLGTFSGQEYRMGVPEREEPDPGWVASEAQRIDDAVGQCGWRLHVAGHWAVPGAMAEALRALGFQESERISGQRALAIRECRVSPEGNDRPAPPR